MYVRVTDGQVEQVRLEIYEPPRFFEAFLRGRSYTEPPDITARICGICPVAYQTSACWAIESACGVALPPELGVLRRLLYCGEWISSHALHIYMLHAPDFLGYPGAVEMARDHREIVERGLALRRTANAIMATIGGRSVHPVNVRVGGFYRVPTRAELEPLADRLRTTLDLAVETVRWVAGFDFPDYSFDHELMSLHDPGRYPIERGSVVTSGGLEFAAAEFEQHVIEEQVPYSMALHARLADRAAGAVLGSGFYLTGPLARYSLNSRWLPPVAAESAHAAGLGDTCRNPFQSIVVRAVEVVCAVEEAIRLIEEYVPPAEPYIAVEPRAGTGHGVSEAPRGLLYHRYSLDAEGTILDAKIVPPTSQNQLAIEDDLRDVVARNAALEDDALRALCEQTIRNYDPCISCATHFLKLDVERR